VDYILERYGEGRLRPAPGTAASALHHQWCWFSEATLVRPIGLNRMLRHTPEDRSLAAETEEKDRPCIEVVDRALAGRESLLGAEFGAADIMMGYSLNLLASNKVLDERYLKAQAYLARLQGRDAYKRLSAL